MKKIVISIMIGIVLVLLSVLISTSIMNKKQVTYQLSGSSVNQQEQYLVNGFIMRNYKNILLTYTLEVPYSDKEIEYLNLYYMTKDKKKNLVLGGNIPHKYHFESIDAAKKDYGVSSISGILENYLDDLYVDLYLNYEDYEKQNVYQTIKLNAKKLG